MGMEGASKRSLSLFSVGGVRLSSLSFRFCPLVTEAVLLLLLVLVLVLVLMVVGRCALEIVFFWLEEETSSVSWKFIV